VDEIQGWPNTPQKPYVAGVRTWLARLRKTAIDLDNAETRALPGLASAPREQLAALNRILFRTERSLTIDPGLPGRPWYRHRIYAPGRYTGYDAKTLPGIREAVEAGKPDEAREQAGQVVLVLRALNDQMVEAVRLLSAKGAVSRPI
jgi:N-acetylated-alpha-linked acidic dipeptidase